MKLNIYSEIKNLSVTLKKLRLRLIDFYIIRKFLGTFFLSILLVIVIAIVFDFSEKLDDFIEHNAPVKAIAFDYYLNFIPYFAILYSHLFTFIAVIFFTSKMAYRTEIIAILSSGVSYRRMLLPYFVSAFIIAVFSYSLMNFVVPNANKVRLEFEENFIYNKPFSYSSRNIHKQIRPGVFIYMESFSNLSNTAYKFSMEKYENDELVSKLMGDYMSWDSIKRKWNIRDYYIRDIDGMKEKITKGFNIDTTLNIYPEDFRRRSNVVESMDIFELNKFIKEQRLQGAENIEVYLIEKYKRVSVPVSTFILTLIGVCVSSRKVRGGTGLHIGIGMGFCFSYILFIQFASQFSISGNLSPFLAMWLPNILFAGIAYYLYKEAPK
jgi:lipopolysaccharide export system permease protein